METESGKRVKIRFRCRLPNGRVYQVGDSNTLEFTVGVLKVPATLEMGVIGMSPGDTRSIRVPAAEVDLFPFPKGSHFALDTKTPPGIAYEFGPGEGGDVSQYIPAGEGKRFREPLPAGTDVIFEIEMLAVEDNT